MIKGYTPNHFANSVMGIYVYSSALKLIHNISFFNISDLGKEPSMALVVANSHSV